MSLDILSQDTNTALALVNCKCSQGITDKRKLMLSAPKTSHWFSLLAMHDGKANGCDWSSQNGTCRPAAPPGLMF